MKTFFLWSYVLAFLGLTVVSIQDTVERTLPSLFRRAEIVLSAFAAAGLIGYASHVHHPSIQHVWRWVAPLLVMGFIGSGIWELWAIRRNDPRRISEFQEHGTAYGAFTLVFTIAFYAPALWFNFRFAFPH